MLLIMTGFILLLVILAIRYRKLLVLKIVKLSYGKYSYEYLTYFKRIFIRSPYQYCFRDEFISHVLFILDKRNELPVYKSFHDIIFEDQTFFTNYNDFIKHKGAPYCFNAFAFEDPHFVVKVVGYQEMISNKKGIAAYYFIDDLFFMGEYILKETSDETKETIMKPYLDPMATEDNFYVENTHDRIIHFQNTGFTIEIKFLTREDKKIIDTLKRYHDQMTTKTLTVEP